MSRLETLIDHRARMVCAADGRVVFGKVRSVEGDHLIVRGEDPHGIPPLGMVDVGIFASGVVASMQGEVRVIDGSVFDVVCREPIDVAPTTLELTIVSASPVFRWNGPFGWEDVAVAAIGPDGFAFSSDIHLPMDGFLEFEATSPTGPLGLRGEVEYQRIASPASTGGVRLCFGDRLQRSHWEGLVSRLTGR